MDEKVYSVSQINRYIKANFDKDKFLSNVTIRGEITNFKAHYTGHFYFTLKDDTSTMKCVMFRSYVQGVKFKPSDGMKVVITGQISVFERDGSYQLYCKKMIPEGVGELYLAYEQLKEKLAKEGLFDVSHKKKIPYLPERVGVITSRTGAVVRDIINVSTRRFDKVNLLIYPAAVQGVNVAETVINGIKTFNKLDNVDVIIIARGGGSFEDLFGFNDENLARTIYASHIPIVSAVGHETDFSISDFVSDLRAPTPSAAAELVYPQYSDLVKSISNNTNRCIVAMQNYIAMKKQYVERIKASRLEKKPLDMIREYRMLIDQNINRGKNNLDIKLEKYKSRCLKTIAKIDALSPLKTLSRGYSVVQKADGSVVNKTSDVQKTDKLKITVTDGKIDVVVD